MKIIKNMGELLKEGLQILEENLSNIPVKKVMASILIIGTLVNGVPAQAFDFNVANSIKTAQTVIGVGSDAIKTGQNIGNIGEVLENFGTNRKGGVDYNKVIRDSNKILNKTNSINKTIDKNTNKILNNGGQKKPYMSKYKQEKLKQQQNNQSTINQYSNYAPGF